MKTKIKCHFSDSQHIGTDSISLRTGPGYDERGKERGGPVCTPQILLFHPFLKFSIVYAKYLAHNLGSATKMIINITLVDDFMTFNILNYKNYIHLSIKLQFNNRDTIYQNKVYWQDVF